MLAVGCLLLVTGVVAQAALALALAWVARADRSLTWTGVIVWACLVVGCACVCWAGGFLAAVTLPWTP